MSIYLYSYRINSKLLFKKNRLPNVKAFHLKYGKWELILLLKTTKKGNGFELDPFCSAEPRLKRPEQGGPAQGQS
jgi:hypothetical protein